MPLGFPEGHVDLTRRQTPVPVVGHLRTAYSISNNHPTYGFWDYSTEAMGGKLVGLKWVRKVNRVRQNVGPTFSA